MASFILAFSTATKPHGRSARVPRPECWARTTPSQSLQWPIGFRSSRGPCNSLETNDAALYGAGDGSGAVVHPQLVKDMEHMRLDGGFADQEPLGDVFVVHALRYELEDHYLPLAQVSFGAPPQPL